MSADCRPGLRRGIKNVVKGLAVAVALWAGLAQAVSAQGVPGVPPASGISFQPPPTTPPANPPSPVTPIRPAPPSTPPRDLFRAGPFTYAPQFDRQGRTPIYPYGGGGYVTFPEPVVERHFYWIPVPDAGSASAASAVPADKIAETPPKPGHRGPLYVIGNCYLGDSPPDPDRLPKGCSSNQTRQIPRR
jgi:hypothetical protein